MEQASSDAPPPPSAFRAAKWARYGLILGLVGILFLGIFCGPAAIYFGVRARTATGASVPRVHMRTAALAIGLGVFDILFWLIRMVGTIRLIGTGQA
jgi:hypothetical protein